MAISKEVADELRRMAPQWGILTTREQIENISDYHNDISYGRNNQIKEQAYHVYLSKDGKDKFHRRRCEIALFRVTGEVSSFFLNMDAGLDYLMVDKMLSIAEEWRFLESEGLLPLLDDFDMIQEVENQTPPRTRAEILRRFMHFYKPRHNIQDWNTRNLDGLRRHMFKVRRDARQWRRKRDAQDSGMPPPKKVKRNDPNPSETEDFDEDCAHSKLINFRQFAEDTHEKYKEVDRLVIREVERLLEGVREAQGHWTPQSALAQAAAFKRFGLQIEKMLGNNLFFALEKVYNSRSEMDEIAEKLRRRKSFSNSSTLTDLSDLVNGRYQEQMGKVAQQPRRKSKSERPSMMDENTTEDRMRMTLDNNIPDLEPDTPSTDGSLRGGVAKFIGNSGPSKRKYSTPYGKRPRNQKSLARKNGVSGSKAGEFESVLRPTRVHGKGGRKTVIKFSTDKKEAVS